MRWNEEPYVRLYTRDTTNWMLLSWEARGVLVLLMRKLSRSGSLSVDPQMRGLAKLIDVPMATVTRAVTELLNTETLTLTGDVLSFPNFPEAQEALRPRSPAERQSAYRERVNSAKAHQKPDSSRRTSRHDDRDARYEGVTERNGRYVLSPSSASSASSADPSSAVGGVGGKAGTPHSKKRSRGPKRPPAPPPAKGCALPEGWTPDEELLGELRTELGVDPMGSVPRFVDHHRQATGRGARSRDWSAKFRNWVRKDASDGKLESLKPHRTMSEAVPSTSTEKPAIERTPEERKTIADRVRMGLGLPKTGTHET